MKKIMQAALYYARKKNRLRWFDSQEQSTTPNVELIINGTFDTNSDSWPTYGSQPPESITIESGQLNLAGVQHSAVAQIIPTEIGESYPIAAYVEQDGYVQVKSIDGTTIIDNLNNGADGTFSDTFVALETQTIIILALGATGLGVFDNTSVKQSKLVINGGFDASLSHWINANSHWAWVSGRAYHASIGSFNTLRTLLSLEIGETYSVTFDAEHVSGGLYRCQSRDVSNNPIADFTYTNDTTDTHTFAFTASEADIYIAFARDDSGVASEFYIDNVLVDKV
ncbi:MAG: hypothetical protein GY829_04005 [Gammaproteobacteria bacterium]|nr:hypothetical protein [Gammaproteobacteria bacterium]